jgi:hypothetical protein
MGRVPSRRRTGLGGFGLGSAKKCLFMRFAPENGFVR